MNLMRNEYKYNTNFRKYVDKYCIDSGCDLEEAFKSEQVKQMFWKYTEI